MIRVELKPEPANFDALVRKPGNTLLRTTPRPSTTQWNSKSFALWRLVKDELRKAHDGICAYSCHWIPSDTGWQTVEHFKAKSDFPKDAYEWANYRLVCGVLNGRKTNRVVLDPFVIQDGWFIIEFPSLLVKPAKNLGNTLQQQITDTRDILGLNDEATCLKSREDWLKSYCLTLRG